VFAGVLFTAVEASRAGERYAGKIGEWLNRKTRFLFCFE